MLNMSNIGIKRKENSVILKYIDDNFNVYKCIVLPSDAFVSLRLNGDLDNFLELVQNKEMIINEREDYVFIEIPDIPEFIYFLSKKNSNSLLIKKIIDFENKFEERLKKLEKDMHKMKTPLRQTGKIFVV